MASPSQVPMFPRSIGSAVFQDTPLLTESTSEGSFAVQQDIWKLTIINTGDKT